MTTAQRKSRSATISATRSGTPLIIFQKSNIDQIPQLKDVDPDLMLSMKAVASVLPFRVNRYVIDQLIDWSKVPDDPMFQLTFPQPGMLDEQHLNRMRTLIAGEAPEAAIDAAARDIRLQLNPHPAGQRNLNVPKVNGTSLPGMQHKYRETVLFFPSAGQTCFSYCTYCFRWPQFVGMDELKFASTEAQGLVEYLKEHKEVESVLLTGGDPLIMRAQLLRRYVEPLLSPELAHITNIRIGSKALAFWPQRFIAENDSDDLLRLFNQIRDAGKHIALMSHYSHPVELDTAVARAALRRVQDAGAVVRCQAPLIHHVNDDAKTWTDMWRAQVRLGAVPYYMFVERDTGARNYFEVPLSRGYEIYTEAYCQLTGLGRTVRGPSMSCLPGKVLIQGIDTIKDEKVFILSFIQARDPSWVNRPFFARFDESATWMDQLKPAFGETEFFFEQGMKRIAQAALNAGPNPHEAAPAA